MANISLKYGATEVPILIELETFLTASGFTDTTDITDILFIIKDCAADSDANALYSGSLTGGEVTIDVTENTASAYVRDFTNLPAGKAYIFAIGVQFTGDSTYREPEMEDDNGDELFSLYITPDTIRA